MKNKILTLAMMLCASYGVWAQDDVYNDPEPPIVPVMRASTSNSNGKSNSDYNPSYDYQYSRNMRRMYDPYYNMPMSAYYNMYSYPNFSSYYYPMNMGSGFSMMIGSGMGMGYGYGSGYGCNAMCGSMYSPFMYNPYSNFGYGAYNNPYFNYAYYYPQYTNFVPSRPSASPTVVLPQQQTARGFGRYDETYRPSPARPIDNNVPQSNMGGYDRNQPSPTIRSGSGFGGSNSGGFGGGGNSGGGGDRSVGGNGGRSGRF